MKKLIALALAGLCIITAFHSPVSAKESGAETPANEIDIVINGELKQVRIIHVFDDGSQLLEGKPAVTAQTRDNITAHKPYYHRNSSGTLLWTITVNGTFSYNGSTSSCISASYDTQINNSAWSVQSGSAYPSGNSAIASVVMARKLLLIVLETVPVTITLTCDKNGNVS